MTTHVRPHLYIKHSALFLFYRWMVKVNNILKSKHSTANEQFMTKFRSYNLNEELKALK